MGVLWEMKEKTQPLKYEDVIDGVTSTIGKDFVDGVITPPPFVGIFVYYLEPVPGEDEPDSWKHKFRLQIKHILLLRKARRVVTDTVYYYEGYKEKLRDIFCEIMMIKDSFVIGVMVTDGEPNEKEENNFVCLEKQ